MNMTILYIVFLNESTIRYQVSRHSCTRIAIMSNSLIDKESMIFLGFFIYNFKVL